MRRFVPDDVDTRVYERLGLMEFHPRLTRERRPKGLSFDAACNRTDTVRG